MPEGSWPPLDTSAIVRNLHRHVEVLSAEIGSRSVFEPDCLRRAEDYVFRSFQASGYDPERLPYRYRGLDIANVSARAKPRNKQKAQYLLSAHYDTIFGTPGADDNASAVAVLLECARLAREACMDSTPAADWEFVAFTAEEPPAFHTRHQGSRVYARSARRQRWRIDGVVNLEMLGYFDDRHGSQKLPFPLHFFGYPRTADFAAVVGNWRSRRLTRELVSAMRANPALPVEYAIAPGRSFLLFALRLSDHSSFWDHGFPAVMVTDTSFYRNSNYHSQSDTIDKLNFAAMAEVVRSLLLFVSHAGGVGTAGK